MTPFFLLLIQSLISLGLNFVARFYYHVINNYLVSVRDNLYVSLTPFGGPHFSKSMNSVTKSCQAVFSATSRKYWIIWEIHVGKISSFRGFVDGESAGVAVGIDMPSSIPFCPGELFDGSGGEALAFNSSGGDVLAFDGSGGEALAFNGSGGEALAGSLLVMGNSSEDLSVGST